MTEIAFLLHPDRTALDAVGPHEVLARLPGAAGTLNGKRATTHWSSDPESNGNAPAEAAR